MTRRWRFSRSRGPAGAGRPRRRCASWAATRRRTARWSSRRVASVPTSPTARRTPASARETRWRRSRSSARPSCSPSAGPRAPSHAPRAAKRRRRPPQEGGEEGPGSQEDRQEDSEERRANPATAEPVPRCPRWHPAGYSGTEVGCGARRVDRSWSFPAVAIRRRDRGARPRPVRVASAPPGEREVRNVLGFPEFRRLWIALSLSSLGDWLGFVATTTLAKDLRHRLLGRSLRDRERHRRPAAPAIIIGPFAGAWGDRFNRRYTMVIAGRAAVRPLRVDPAGALPVVAAGRRLPHRVALAVLDPGEGGERPQPGAAEHLESANRISLITTYGSAAVASTLFALLAEVSHLLGAALPHFRSNPVDLALYFDAVTFLVSAATVWTLTTSPGPAATATRPESGSRRGSRSSRAGSSSPRSSGCADCSSVFSAPSPPAPSPIGLAPQFVRQPAGGRRRVRRAVRDHLRRSRDRHARRVRGCPGCCPGAALMGLCIRRPELSLPLTR